MKNLKISTKKWKIKKQVEIIENKNSALDDLTAELLTKEYYTDKFSYNALNKCAGDVKLHGDRLKAFRTLYYDKNNASYFDKLSPRMKFLIKTRILDIVDPYNKAVTTLLNHKGVDPNTLGYLPKRDATPDDVTLHRDLKDFFSSLKTREQTSHTFFEQYGELEEGINKNEMPAFIQLQNCKDWIEEHPVQYEANKELINHLYESALKNADSIAHLAYSTNKCKVFSNRSKDYQGIECQINLNLSFRIRQKNEFQTKLLNQDIEVTMNALKHLLRNTELSPDGAALLKQLKAPK